MREFALCEGDAVFVENAHGQVEGIVLASDDVGPQTIAFAFGWGDPLDPRPPREKGSNVQRLIPDDWR